MVPLRSLKLHFLNRCMKHCILCLQLFSLQMNSTFYMALPFLSVLDAVQINCQHNIQCESLRPANPLVCCQKCHIILVCIPVMGFSCSLALLLTARYIWWIYSLATSGRVMWATIVFNKMQWTSDVKWLAQEKLPLCYVFWSSQAS